VTLSVGNWKRTTEIELRVLVDDILSRDVEELYALELDERIERRVQVLQLLETGFRVLLGLGKSSLGEDRYELMMHITIGKIILKVLDDDVQRHQVSVTPTSEGLIHPSSQRRRRILLSADLV